MTTNERQNCIASGVQVFIDGCYSNGVTVFFVEPTDLVGRGVLKKYSEKRYYISENLWNKIKKFYKWTTDF